MSSPQFFARDRGADKAPPPAGLLTTTDAHENIPTLELRVVENLEPQKSSRDPSRLNRQIEQVCVDHKPFGFRDADGMLVAVVISADAWKQAQPLLKQIGLIRDSQ